MLINFYFYIKAKNQMQKSLKFFCSENQQNINDHGVVNAQCYGKCNFLCDFEIGRD